MYEESIADVMIWYEGSYLDRSDSEDKFTWWVALPDL